MARQGKNATEDGNGGDIRQELTIELKHLRVMIRDAGENFILRREAELETFLGYLEGLPSGKIKANSPAWLREIRKLDVKPSKGRLRDLKKINKVVGELLENIAAVCLEVANDRERPRRKHGVRTGSGKPASASEKGDSP